MAQKTAAALTTDNNNIVVNQTLPESITPTTIGALFQSFIDSFWNKTDSPFTLPPLDCVKADVPTLASVVANDKRWLKITDRADANPLFVQIINLRIHPIGVWVKGGKELAVIMDYLNGYNGETKPFLQIIDENQDSIFTGRDFYVTGRNLILNNSTPITKILQNSATLNFPSTSAGDSTELTIALTGAAINDIVDLGIPKDSVPTGSGNSCNYMAYVSATNVITVRFSNGSSGALDPNSGLFTVRIIK